MRAYKSPDGKYRVTWKQAFRLTNFTRVEEPETGEPLQADSMALSILGAVGGVATSTTIALAFIVWWHVLSFSHGGVVAAVTVVLVASILFATAIIVSNVVTFTRSSETSRNRR